MGLSKLTRGERLTAASGAALFVAVALPWFRLHNELGFPGNTKSGWEIGLHWGAPPALIGAAAAAAVVAHKGVGVALPKLAVSWPVAHLVGAAVAATFVLVKLATGVDSYDRSWGLLVATAAALAFLAGGALMFQERRSTTR